MSTGTGRIFKRESTWWIDFSFRGKRYRESSGSSRKKDAQQLIRKRIEEMGRGRLIGPDAERLMYEDLEELIQNDYIKKERRSTERLDASLKALRSFFAGAMALDITTDRVDAYIAFRKREGRANSTIRNEVNALRRALRLAHRAGKLPTMPHIEPPSVTAVRTGFLTGPEVDAIISHLPDPLGAVVRFAHLTGWRKGEVLSLRWSQVDFGQGTVRLEPGATKNLEGREFPFSPLPQLRDTLDEQRWRTRQLERESGQIIPHVFHRDGRPVRNMSKAWQTACERAGVGGAWFHDLRRSAVRNLERAGVPQSTAMKLTGHLTASVYRRYAIADHEVLEEGVGKLAKLHGTPEKEAERRVLPIQK